jgi:6-phosphogluconolactonase
MSSFPLLIVENEAELSKAAASRLAENIIQIVGATGACSVALAGGSTPQPVYRLLAEDRRIPWAKVEIFFGDERAVPPDQSDSNYRMARRALLDHVPIEAHRIHRMEADRPDLDAAARDYESLLPDALDVLVLGMGADGHTASLFPGHDAVAERIRRVLPVREAPLAPRLTITPPVIQRAKNLIVLIEGGDKAATVRRALEGPDDPNALPIQLARHGVWIVDRASAALLSKQPSSS